MNDMKALDDLIDDAMNEEKALATKAEELALQSKQFAEYLAAKKHQDERLEVLWMLVRDYMEQNGITEHTNNFISLKLVPTGKYSADDMSLVADDFCKITRTIDNKKVTAYKNLTGKLPDGVKSTGNRLIKKIL